GGLAALGTVAAVLLIAVVAAMPRAPFVPPSPPGGAAPPPPDAVARGLRLARLSPTAAGATGIAVMVMAVVAFLLALLAAWRRLAPRRAAFAVALFGWNPVVVAYGAGGGHNDVLVALCVAGALAVLAGWWPGAAAEDGGAWAPLTAVALLTLATLVKVSAAPAL